MPQSKSLAVGTNPILVADHGRKTFDIGRKPQFTPNGADENLEVVPVV